MTVVSLFAGIGGFDLALERLGHQVIWANEFDRYAADIYDHHFARRVDRRDITTVPATDIPDHDLLVGGFPCQAFSIAGKRRGFDDIRGTLFFDIARVCAERRPPYLLLENVKGLLSHDGGRTFGVILSTLDELGYDCQWQVCNSKDFGVPQNRERVFIVGHLRGVPRPEVFPLTGEEPTTLPEPVIVSGRPIYDDGTRRMTYTVSDIAPTILATQYKNGDNQPKVIQMNPGAVQDRRVYDQAGLSPTINPAAHAGGAVIPKVVEGMGIRRLTPLETERLQGFPDLWTAQGINGPISDTQRYKTVGNAVSVPVVQTIAVRLTASCGAIADLVREERETEAQ